MFDMLNKGTAWKIKGLKNIMRRARFCKINTFFGWPLTATP